VSEKIRLGYLVSHPIQYQAPLLRLIASHPNIDLKVYFCSDFSVRGYRDPGFKCDVTWDVPLLEGYHSDILPSVGDNTKQSLLRPFNYGLKKRLKRDRIDVLWLHGYAKPFFISALINAKRLGIKVMVRAESMGFNESQSNMKNKMKPFFYQWLNKVADCFLTVGTLNKQFLLKNAISEDKMVPAPYTVDNDFFQSKACLSATDKMALQSKLELNPSRPIILYASKFLPRKCADDLIKAYLQLLHHHPNVKPYLILIGDGEMRDDLQQLASQTDSDHIRFLGFINQQELPTYYSLCDVFVLPSERENWGLIVNEVMNAGKPIIVSNEVGCAPDLIDDYKNGRIFPTHDINALEACLHWATTLNEPEKEAIQKHALAKIQSWGLQETANGIIKAATQLHAPASTLPGPLKLLFIGESAGRAKQRIDTFRAMGIQTTVIPNIPNQKSGNYAVHLSLPQRISYKLRVPIDSTKLNKRVLAAIKKERFHIIFVEKSLVLHPSTLRKIKAQLPNARICWNSEDDMYAKHNQSVFFRKGLPYYDTVFTTKSYNCQPNELPKLGAKNVVFIDKGFDETLHYPMEVTDSERTALCADVNFIGTFEPVRAQRMLFLAQNGIHVRIWGNGWQHWIGKHPNLTVEGKAIYQCDYTKALCGSKINLCFLRKINRDLQTDRTMEIPACGAFMLAERTNEHLRLFEEGKEAAFFDIDNPQELLEKVHYYLNHEQERQHIAKAGRKRCLQSGYSHRHRLETMLNTVKNLSCVE